MLMRSLMFVPAHNNRLMDSAARSIADVLLLDVEDSVQPKVNKQAARDNIIKYVESGSFKKHYVFPRINDRDSGELLKDLMQLTIDGIHGFMYPKSTVGEDIYFIDKLLETIECEKGCEVGKYKLIPLIETAGAVINASDICSISKRVVAIAFGCEDYVTDIEGVHDEDAQSIFVARSMIAMAARANKVAPIDTVHIKVHDLVDLEKNLKIAKNLGFEGMLILNPKEIDLVHKYFTPSIEEISDANEMIEVAIEYEKEGKGVAVKNGKFIGPPMVLAAKKIINKINMINGR